MNSEPRPEPKRISQHPVEVCGYQITPVDGPVLLRHVLWQIAERQGGWVLALNLDLVARGERDPAFAQLIRGAEMTVADGYPLVWGARKKDRTIPPFDRATGSDLTQSLLNLVDPNTTAIIGGKDPRLALRKEGLNPDEGWFIFDGIVQLDASFVADLRSKLEGRTLVFVALGVPKQERLIALLKPTMPETTFIGVGGSFEFIAGLSSRAPVWMQKRGLEWFYRLCTEPRRLWRRYLIDYIPGAKALLKDVWGGKKSGKNSSAL